MILKDSQQSHYINISSERTIEQQFSEQNWWEECSAIISNYHCIHNLTVAEIYNYWYFIGT